MRSLIGIASCLLASSAFAGSSIVETFESPNAAASWAWNPSVPSVTSEHETAGGNPDGYIRGQRIVKFPGDLIVRTFQNTQDLEGFTGDYRAMGVTQISVDIRHFESSGELFPGLHMTLELGTDIVFPGFGKIIYLEIEDSVPAIGQDWTTYTFEIDSQSTTLPDEWQTVLGLSTPEDWDAIITNVEHIGVRFGGPELFGGEADWVLGADNMTVTFASSTPADLDGDGVVGPADLAMLLGAWGPCDPRPAECEADLDGDGTVGPADLAALLGDWG